MGEPEEMRNQSEMRANSGTYERPEDGQFPFLPSELGAHHYAPRHKSMEVRLLSGRKPTGIDAGDEVAAGHEIGHLSARGLVLGPTIE